MKHDFPRTFALPGRHSSAGLFTDAPLRPHEYLRLRRQAAGMSISAVAIMMMGNSREVPAAMDLIRSLETAGITARHDVTLAALRTAFPFDVDVYRQLRDEPADRHPRICRGCGCSEWDPCDSGHGACAWASAHACTRCVGDEAAPRECGA